MRYCVGDPVLDECCEPRGARAATEQLAAPPQEERPETASSETLVGVDARVLRGLNRQDICLRNRKK